MLAPVLLELVVKIAEQRFLVTGASRGIGRALAETLVDAGARLVISARSGKDLQKAADELMERASGVAGAAVESVRGDIGLVADAELMVERARQRFGGIDVLVNNAGVMNDPAPIADIPAEVWDDVLRINVTGTANVIRAALPIMEAQRAGVIVNVSSTWGRIAAGRVAPYCASKFALEAMTQSLAEEVGEGIVAVALNPGVIATEMLAVAVEGDVSMYPTPESLAPKWLLFFDDMELGWSGRTFDLASF